MNFKEITLEDVETAIRILQYYIMTSRRAESILKSAIQVKSKGINPMNLDFNDFVQLALQIKQQEKQPQEQQEEITLTQEDIEKMKKIKEKLSQS